MANSNDFQPFGVGVGSNVETAAAWNASTQRTQGFQTGQANSTQFNTQMRLTAFVASMIAQFTADFGPGNVVDSGVVATLEAQFEAALYKYLSTFFLPFLPSNYANVYVATTGGSPAGNDSTGTGSITAPWATMQHAINTVSGFQSTNAVNIHVAAGTYVAASHTTLANFAPSQIASWSIVGTSGAASTILNAAALGCRGFTALGSQVSISGFSFSSYYESIVAENQSSIGVSNCNFISSGSLATAIASYIGSSVNVSGSLTITGIYYTVFQANTGTIQVGYQDANITLPAAITFGTTTVNATAFASQGGSIVFVVGAPVTWAGSTPTGSRFNISSGGSITTGQSATWIPGSTAGSISFTPLQTGSGNSYTATYQ